MNIDFAKNPGTIIHHNHTIHSSASIDAIMQGAPIQMYFGIRLTPREHGSE
jgi:hypothetical protein